MQSKNKQVQELLDGYSEVWALNHSLALLGWDMETHMPEAGTRARGMATGQLAMMMQKAMLGMKGGVTKAEKL